MTVNKSEVLYHMGEEGQLKLLLAKHIHFVRRTKDNDLPEWDRLPNDEICRLFDHGETILGSSSDLAGG